MDNYVVEVENLKIRFNLASEKVDNLKEYAIKFMKHELMFQEFLALQDINLKIKKGESWGLVGANGSGKSTLLRCINRLETPSSGEILYKGENILDPKYDVNSLRSHISRVFQSFNLFNNRDVLENCVIGQRKVLHRKKKEAEEIAL